MSNTETKTTIKTPFILAAIIALGLLASMVTGCSSNKPKATDLRPRFIYKAMSLETGSIAIITAYQPVGVETAILDAPDSVWVNDQNIVDDKSEDVMMYKIIELKATQTVYPIDTAKKK